MLKEEVIERLCALVTKVGGTKFHNEYAHDCFCGMNPQRTSDFRCDEQVIEFIEAAVNSALEG